MCVKLVIYKDSNTMHGQQNTKFFHPECDLNRSRIIDVRVQIHSFLTVKCKRYCTGFDETHACLTTFFKKILDHTSRKTQKTFLTR